MYVQIRAMLEPNSLVEVVRFLVLSPNHYLDLAHSSVGESIENPFCQLPADSPGPQSPRNCNGKQLGVWEIP